MPGIDEVPTRVIFRSPIAGPLYLANVAVGVGVCAALGGLLGLAISNVLAGAAVGGAIALIGGVFRRRHRDELAPGRIELVEAGVRLQLPRGRELLLQAGDVVSVEAASPDESVGVPVHWLLIERVGLAPLRIRTRDAAESERVASQIARALGIETPALAAPGRSPV